MLVRRQDFNPLIGQAHHTYMLPREQISEIYIDLDTRERMIVGMQWVENPNTVRFLLGNFACVTIPCNKFKPKADGTVPDFEHPHIDDYGFDLYFGKYKIDIREVLFE